jgi:hypothetical protein
VRQTAKLVDLGLERPALIVVSDCSDRVGELVEAIFGRTDHCQLVGEAV